MRVFMGPKLSMDFWSTLKICLGVEAICFVLHLSHYITFNMSIDSTQYISYHKFIIIYIQSIYYIILIP